MSGWGVQPWGISPWGLGYDLTAGAAPTQTTPDDHGVWPFSGTYSGGPSADSTDPFGLVCTYGARAWLYAAVLLSLYADARCGADTLPPDGTDDRRGWMGDALPIRTTLPDDARPRGSLLWLYERAKVTPTTAAELQQVVRDALAWLITAGIADDITVQTATSGSAYAVSIVVRKGSGGVKFINSDIWENYR